MRGADRQTAAMFSYLSPETLVPENHPLRAIRPLVNAALERLSGDFDRIYSAFGRDSIAPEKLLRALLLQAFFSVRSERQLMEQLTYNMMFRWFVGLSMDAPVWDVSVFTKNRERLLRGDVARALLAAILVDPKVKPLLWDEHFSVDGTLIEAWPSMKSFKHARLYKKAAGQAATLCHMGHVLTENRNGLVVEAELALATGTAEREAACAMVDELEDEHRITVGADKAYDSRDFVADMRRLGVTPHVSQNTKRRRSAIDGRTTRHRGYAISQRKRKRIEEVFGWMKAAAGFRKTRHRSTARVGWMFTLNAAAYNLVRLPKLLGAAA